MDTHTNKEKWIDEVMGSTYGINRAQPGADLQERINERISAPFTRTTAAIPVTRWVAAAILLLALNIGSAVYFSKQHSDHTSTTNNPFAAEMQAESTYNY